MESFEELFVNNSEDIVKHNSMLAEQTNQIHIMRTLVHTLSIFPLYFVLLELDLKHSEL